jgi:predicted acyl esterase
MSLIVLETFGRHLGGAGQNDGGEDAATAAARVRVYVTGAEEWRGYKTWPPTSDPCVFSILKGGRIIDLQGGDARGEGGAYVPDYRALRKGSASFERLLSEDARGLPCESVYENVSSYVYDPEDPTPGLGGCSFNPWNSGAVDCRSAGPPFPSFATIFLSASPQNCSFLLTMFAPCCRLA